MDDYKANRAAMPDDLAEQISWVHEACEALGVPDPHGAAATRPTTSSARWRAAPWTPGYDVAIVSIDKDFFQLVRDHVSRVRPARGRRLVRRSRASTEKFGVQPAQVVDVLALVGDTSDNVAGVPGIGKKGAVDLVTQFGSLDALLATSGAAEAQAARGADHAPRGGAAQPELVTIRTDVPLEVDLESLALPAARRGSAATTLFSRLAFRSLMNEYAPTADTTPHELRARHDRERRSTRWWRDSARPGSSPCTRF